MTLRQRAAHVAAGMLLAFALSAGVVVWQAVNKPPAVVAKPAPELNGEQTTTLDCLPRIVYRDKVREKLGVPEEAGHVLDSVRIAPDEHPHTVTAAMDPTGRTRLFDRQDPLPWFARAARAWRFELGYGPLAVPGQAPQPAAYGGVEYLPVTVSRAALGGGAHLYSTGLVWAGLTLRF